MLFFVVPSTEMLYPSGFSFISAKAERRIAKKEEYLGLHANYCMLHKYLLCFPLSPGVFQLSCCPEFKGHCISFLVTRLLNS